MARSFKKHSLPERARMYKIYQQELWAGKTLAEIAYILRISKDTLLRWQRDELSSKDPVTPPKPINEIMHGLCRTDVDSSSFTLLFDVCAFNAWLRWPLSPKYHYSAVISGIIQYVASKFSTDSLGDLPQDLSNGIVGYISLTQFADLFSPQTDRQCDFTQHRLHGQKYTEIQVAGNITRYILGTQSPTVGGAYDALKAGIDGQRYDVSWSWFQNFWRARMPASPFLSVQNYHCKLNWTPNPFEADFVEYIDEILLQYKVRRQYFADTKDVLYQTRMRLDPRSAVYFDKSLIFPDGLPPSAMEIASVNATT